MSLTAIEHWYLTPEAAEKAFEVMQEMDDILEGNAHNSAGWDGHARFFQSHEDPTHVIMYYSWKSKAEHELLLESETALLKDFLAKYCTRDREVEYATELPVDV
ncbi:hypothetical protein GCM10010174_49710 [Kutzneria viridogrisea]|uniref:3-oxoacyl-[acyl-carrier protein] reductase n=1 Tax=Kutzneria viridogrisea TaxID=47990 RepID=A0ABR6B8U3_9PSEU|nr:3-oxoacyl-[acyl-carrier protein] reductase [Kutzneria viridogrisea]